MDPLEFTSTQRKAQQREDTWGPQRTQALLLLRHAVQQNTDLFWGRRAAGSWMQTTHQSLPQNRQRLPGYPPNPKQASVNPTEDPSRPAQERSSHEGSKTERTDKLYTRKMESTGRTQFNDGFTNWKAAGPEAEKDAHRCTRSASGWWEAGGCEKWP